MKNIDAKTVVSFSDEWTKFDQSGVADGEAEHFCRDHML